MKYIMEKPVKAIIGEQKYKTSIHWRNGEFITDEPEKIEGKDLGPDPHTLLLSSLVACTAATLRMYIDHKKLNIPEITVEANLGQRINSRTGEITTRIDKSISFGDTEVDDKLKQRRIEISGSCPISKILKGNVTIETPDDQ
ncbi:OsmC family protein [Albibacterium indicum]|uniref:OsmC family protein n=1 Tax=Albibacterium indicum TaxID=2292082 RepID=UPI000E502109|nr:OsmC family protein [Pedobacter indicus]